MFGFGSLIVFLITQRIPTKKYKKREQNSIHWTNLALIAFIIIMSWAIGFRNFLLIQLPVIWMAAAAGVWLFYVQHQFEGVYWKRDKDWDFVKAGLQGSSFYQLPKVLQWFSGNIGFHHIHHLSLKIPNYLLENCYRENTIFHVKPVRLLDSLKSLNFRLWDENNQRLVTFQAFR